MKKTLILIVALIIATTTSLAQQATATLNHNDTLTVFYGIDAFKDACTKAQYGDVISLSHGQFTGPTIDTGVTVIGSGMDADTLQGTFPTIVLGNTYVNDDCNFKNIYFQNVGSNNKNVNNVSYERCKIDYFRNKYVGSALTPSFLYLYSCVVHSLIVEDNVSLQAVNSYVIVGCSKSCKSCVFENCIVEQDGGSGINRSTLSNCIILGYPGYDTFSSDCYVMNSLLKSDMKSPFIGCIAAVNSWVVPQSTQIFKDGSDYYELTDEIKNAYKGTDGKELGIYGGAHTFSHKPMTHHITKCEVAPKTTPDGKLSVHIEVSGTEQ